MDLPDFVHSFQCYIDDGSIILGWHTLTKFLQGLAHYVSATPCKLSCPGSLHHAMPPSHPDHPIWLNSYKEEYRGLTDTSTFDVISVAEYHTIHVSKNKMAILSMGILLVTKDEKMQMVIQSMPKVVLLYLVIKTQPPGLRLIAMLLWLFSQLSGCLPPLMRNLGPL